MIAVVALLLIMAPFIVAVGLAVLHREGVAAAERERRNQGAAADRAAAIRRGGLSAEQHYANAADWDLVARQQRRDGMHAAAMLSNQWADRARAKAREGA